MTVKEVFEAGSEPKPIYFKGDSRFGPTVYARIIELGIIFDIPSYHIRVQDLRYPKAFHWKDIADCEVIRSCEECPRHKAEDSDCGNCPIKKRSESL
jgi:hypothetical protein